MAELFTTARESAYNQGVAAKSATGIGTPKVIGARHLASNARFFIGRCPRIPTVSMVAWVGQPSGWPVSCNAGRSKPAHVTTLSRLEPLGGDCSNQLQEAAIMATTLARDPSPELFPVRHQAEYLDRALNDLFFLLHNPRVRRELSETQRTSLERIEQDVSASRALVDRYTDRNLACFGRGGDA